MKKAGNFSAKSSKEIKGSKIGIGFECLDRKMWDDNEEAYRLVGELGVKHARVQTGWSRCEKEKGRFEFAWLDRIVDKLLDVGITPWFNLGYGNIHHTESQHQDSVGWAPIYSEESKEAWKRYTRELVKHFRDRITHYEIWNEPDIGCFWNKGPNPDEYMELVKLTAPVIKENYPGAKIIGGAMARGFSWSGFAMLEEYLKRGFAELIDVYSYHRYRIVPELYSRADFEHLKALFRAYGGEHVELWQAESGCPSRSATTQALKNTPVNKEVQAKILCRSILTDLDMGTDYTCYFHFSDFKFYYRDGFCDVPNHFGLITYDSPPERKPSYFAFQVLCSLFDDDTSRVSRAKIDFGLKDMENSREKYSFQEEMIHIRATAFERSGFPLISYYMPADLLPSYAGNEPYREREIELYIWASGRNIEEPVLVDPLSGEVFDIAYEIEKNKNITALKAAVILHDVPLRDYPLFVTDKKAIPDMIKPLKRK